MRNVRNETLPFETDFLGVDSFTEERDMAVAEVSEVLGEVMSCLRQMAITSTIKSQVNTTPKTKR